MTSNPPTILNQPGAQHRVRRRQLTHGALPIALELVQQGTTGRIREGSEDAHTRHITQRLCSWWAAYFPERARANLRSAREFAGFSRRSRGTEPAAS